MPKVARAWVDLGNRNLYLKVGSRWYEKGYAYEDSYSSVRWMNRHCLELHPREARKLDRERREAK